MSLLSPCPSCHRHAKITDAACPFCGDSLDDKVRRMRLPRGAKRAVLFAMGLGAAASGCDAFADPIDTTTETSPETPQPQPVYGAVAPPPPEPQPSGSLSGPIVHPTSVPSGTTSPTTPTPSTTMTPSATQSQPVPEASTAPGTGFTPDAGPTASTTTVDAAAGGADAGVGEQARDAGTDASAPDAAPTDSSQGGAIEMPGPVPPYGAPPVVP